MRRVQVAPFTGAWIEILDIGVTFVVRHVAPFTGAWIEIFTFQPMLDQL